MSSDLSGIFDFFIFWGKGERGKDLEKVNVKEGFEGRWGIKVEFGGFIGGFGKIFFTKGGIKREKEGFWGWDRGFLGYVWEGM